MWGIFSKSVSCSLNLTSPKRACAMEQSRNIEMWHCPHLILFLPVFNDFKQVHFRRALSCGDPWGCLALFPFSGIYVMSSRVRCAVSPVAAPSHYCCASSPWLRRQQGRAQRPCAGRSWSTRCSLCVEREAFISVNQQAMAPMHGGHVALWTSAASKAVSCGAWRCTVHLSSLTRLPALCGPSATQTCPEHLRLVPQGTKWTRAQSVGQHSSQTRQKTRRDLYLDIVILPSRKCIRKTQVEAIRGAEITECREEANGQMPSCLGREKGVALPGTPVEWFTEKQKWC